MLDIRLFLSKTSSEWLDFAGHLRFYALDLLVLSLAPYFIQVGQHLVHHRFGNIARTFIPKLMSNFVSIFWNPVFLFCGARSNLGRCGRCNRVHESYATWIHSQLSKFLVLLRRGQHRQQPSIFHAIGLDLHLRGALTKPSHQHRVVVLLDLDQFVLLLPDLTVPVHECLLELNTATLVHLSADVSSGRFGLPLLNLLL